jgi:hypothetical protein
MSKPSAFHLKESESGSVLNDSLLSGVKSTFMCSIWKKSRRYFPDMSTPVVVRSPFTFVVHISEGAQEIYKNDK